MDISEANLTNSLAHEQITSFHIFPSQNFLSASLLHRSRKQCTLLECTLACSDYRPSPLRQRSLCVCHWLSNLSFHSLLHGSVIGTRMWYFEPLRVSLNFLEVGVIANIDKQRSDLNTWGCKIIDEGSFLLSHWNILWCMILEDELWSLGTICNIRYV